MRYTREEREDLARRKEQWILRVEQGENRDKVRRELKLKLKTSVLPSLKQRYKAGGRKWQALLDRRHGIATKGTAEVKAFGMVHPVVRPAELFEDAPAIRLPNVGATSPQIWPEWAFRGQILQF